MGAQLRGHRLQGVAFESLHAVLGVLNHLIDHAEGLSLFCLLEVIQGQAIFLRHVWLSGAKAELWMVRVVGDVVALGSEREEIFTLTADGGLTPFRRAKADALHGEVHGYTK